ncbi:MAG: DNA recombination protein RmuC [Propionibacteriales bacterium]|nr:DNA recombination protein RmuC [Propionibacteriales bacterium]
MNATTLVIATLALMVGAAIGFAIGQLRAEASRADLRQELKALSAQAVTDSTQQVLALSSRAVNDSTQQVLALAESRATATEQVVRPVRESLDRLNERIQRLETSGESWQSQLKQQVESVHLSGVELRRETQALSEALRRPQVRGNWGEMQLRRSLELAGLTAHCTFDEQVSSRSDDRLLRPDVVVSMAGGKHIVVDSKVPLDAFLTATQADGVQQRTDGLVRHARQVRQHIDSLAGKAYWRQFTPAPEFVVMFMPGESIFAQALDTDPTLLEYAVARKVMLATPTTLIAMLKTVSYAWSQDAIADNAREVVDLGRELYERVGTVGGHLDKLGRSLTAAVKSYNSTVASVETRVLVSARKFEDLDVVEAGMPRPEGITETTRNLTAAELLDHEPAPVIEGRLGQEQWKRHAVGE